MRHLVANRIYANPNVRLAAVIFSAVAASAGCDRNVSVHAPISGALHIERRVAGIAGSDAYYYLTIDAAPLQTPPLVTTCSANISVRFTAGRPTPRDSSSPNDLFEPVRQTVMCNETVRLQFGPTTVTLTPSWVGGTHPHMELSYAYNSRL